MAQSDLETVRRIIEAFNRSDVDVLLEVFHPEAEWHPLLGELGGGVYRGHDGIRTLVRELGETWEDLRVELEREVDAGDCVFAFTRSRGLGRGSGAEVDLRLVALMEMRDGRVLRASMHGTLEDALAAAGMDALP